MHTLRVSNERKETRRPSEEQGHGATAAIPDAIEMPHLTTQAGSEIQGLWKQSSECGGPYLPGEEAPALEDMNHATPRASPRPPSQGVVGLMLRTWRKWGASGAPPKAVEIPRHGLNIEAEERANPMHMPPKITRGLNEHARGLVDLGAYVETERAAVVCPMPTAPKPDGGRRGVHDSGELNKLLPRVRLPMRGTEMRCKRRSAEHTRPQWISRKVIIGCC